MPHIVAVPWLATLSDGYHEARHRIRSAVHVLRHGDDQDDGWGDEDW